MAQRQRITKIKFLSISRDIKVALADNTYSAPTIAKKHGVSTVSVQKIRSAKTWPGYVTAKQLVATKVARRKADAFEKAQAATPAKRPLNPNTPTEVFGTDAQLSIDLRALEAAPTRQELETALKVIDERFNALYDLLRKKADKRVMPWNK